MAPRVAWNLRLSVVFFQCIVLSLASARPTLSGCQVCATTGDCSNAYLSNPGQYCGSWLDQQSSRQSCCCPIGAQCKLSNYACKCLWATTPAIAPMPAPSPAPTSMPFPAPTPVSSPAPAQSSASAAPEPMHICLWIDNVLPLVAVFLGCCAAISIQQRSRAKRALTQARTGAVTAIPRTVPACNVVPATHALDASTAIQHPYAAASPAPVYDYV